MEPPLRIQSATARQILDSRGYPTIAVQLILDDGSTVGASSPAGASTGRHEAVELRDRGVAYGGRSVHSAVSSVRGEISQLLASRPWPSLRELDDQLRALDSTANLSRLGANAVVAVSIAAARGFARSAGLPLHKWIAGIINGSPRMPVPHFNVLNGGAHASNSLDFQEFMIAPVGSASEAEAVEIGATIYHALASLVRQRCGAVGLGDEGGFAPDLSEPREALDLIMEAIEASGSTPGLNSVAIAIDPAANGFYQGAGIYQIGERSIGRQELVDYYRGLLDEYPLRSIEDGFAEDDPLGWRLMFDAAAELTQLVGDDLYVTDAQRIESGAEKRYSNSALIKPNQSGTVSGTLDALAAASSHGMTCMVSHRSGETTDSFIADLAVGVGAGQIKAGAPARGERVAKYNRLMRIEEDFPDIPFGLAPEKRGKA